MSLMRALARVDSVVLPRLSRGARRINRFARRRPAGALGVAAVGLTLVAGVTVIVESAGHSRSVMPPDKAVQVGVTDGQWIPDYVDSSRQRMAQLALGGSDLPVYALVSLNKYLTPDQVATMVRNTVATTKGDSSGQLTTVLAKARVPIQGRQTEIVTLPADRVPDDMVAKMMQVATDKDRDAARYEGQSAADPAGPAHVSAELARAEARAYRSRCACIYALVVRGIPASLVRLADEPETRVVDPAPQVTDPDAATFVPPLPEQTDLVFSPPDGPVSTRPSA